MIEHRLLRRIAVPLAALSLFALSGCARLGLGGGDPAGYRGMAETYEGFDFKVLKGRTIVLDPGHGGRYPGAVGPGGLTEKEVNLRVAEILRDLLVSYGAIVKMTRSADTDLLPADSSVSLRRDLAARVDSANAADSAVVFLSIHHNSLGTGDTRYNATETYYKMGDTGPSLDLALYLHRHLVRNIGLPKQAVLPGNYYVLRDNRHPAVLGEASYLSHRGTEKKLGGDDARRIEAYSYLLGLVDYLSGGIPVIENLLVKGQPQVQHPYPQVSARVYDQSAGEGIDPQQIELTIDGQAVPFRYDPSSGAVSGRAAGPLDNGPHCVALMVRNLRGNAAREAADSFAVASPPAQVNIQTSLSPIPLDGRTPVQLCALVTDRWGRPVADGTEVMIELSDPNYPPRILSTDHGAVCLSVTAVTNRPLTARASVGELVAEKILPVGQPGGSVLVLTTLNSKGEPLEGVAVSLPDEGFFTTGPQGRLTLSGLREGPYRIRLEKKGFLPVRDELTLGSDATGLFEFRFEPVMGGVLLGKKVVLDPQAGGDSPGQLGASGTRETDVNSRVAELLKDYLERAGAQVRLTRSFEEGPGVWERALRANEYAGDILISISHSGIRKKIAPAVVVHHYPSSADGARLASLIAGSLQGFAGRPFAGAAPGSERIIQQTACPAVWVRAASVADPEVEDALSGPSLCRAEAHAVFIACCRYFGWNPPGETPHLLGRVSDGRGSPISGALVLLDGWRPAQSDSYGRFIFEYVEPGKHRIEIVYQGKTYGPHPGEPGRLLELLIPPD